VEKEEIRQSQEGEGQPRERLRGERRGMKKIEKGEAGDIRQKNLRLLPSGEKGGGDMRRTSQ